MITSNSIQPQLQALKEFCADHAQKYPEDDVRADFFGMLWDIFDNYYKGHLAVDFAGSFQNKKLKVEPEFGKDNAVHLANFIEIDSIAGFKTSFLSNLNRRFIIDTWSTFELSINLVAEAVLSADTIESLLNFETRDILEILKKEEIKEPKTMEKLKKRFDRDGLTHVPINRKVHKILELIKDCYKRNAGEDEKFLIFYGKFRNAMHANFIYYGKDYNYEFKGNRFQFRNGKIILYENKFDQPTDLYIALFNEVKDIFYNIVLCINPANPILYPDTGVYWDE